MRTRLSLLAVLVWHRCRAGGSGRAPSSSCEEGVPPPRCRREIADHTELRAGRGRAGRRHGGLAPFRAAPGSSRAEVLVTLEDVACRDRPEFAHAPPRASTRQTSSSALVRAVLDGPFEKGAGWHGDDTGVRAFRSRPGEGLFIIGIGLERSGVAGLELRAALPPRRAGAGRRRGDRSSASMAPGCAGRQRLAYLGPVGVVSGGDDARSDEARGRRRVPPAARRAAHGRRGRDHPFESRPGMDR